MIDDPKKFKIVEPPIDPKAYFADVAKMRKPLQPVIHKVEVLAEVRVGRVGGDDWFQVNPDEKMQAYGYCLKDKDKNYYFVHENMWQASSFDAASQAGSARRGCDLPAIRPHHHPVPRPKPGS
jgi:hypothetical protein